MKTKIYYVLLLSFFVLFLIATNVHSQNVWTQRANSGYANEGCIGFSINNKGYQGLGSAASLREYDPVTDTWSSKTSFPSSFTNNAVVFVISGIAYVGTGHSSPITNFTNSFYAYDPSTNTWSSKAGIPGGDRTNAVGFAIGNKGYVATGWNGSFLNDLWEYDPTLNSWTQKANFIGTARSLAVAFTINGKGYVGTGWDTAPTTSFYEYDPGTNQWTQKANFPGAAVSNAVSFVIGNKGYICTGQLTGGGDTQEMYSYDPVSNSWTHELSLAGLSRFRAYSFELGNSGYVGSGYNTNSSTILQDLWEFGPDPLTNTNEIPDGNGLIVIANNVSNIISILYNDINLIDGYFMITDIYGRAIRSEKLDFYSNKYDISISNFKTGLYLYYIVENNQIIKTGKFIKN